MCQIISDWWAAFALKDYATAISIFITSILAVLVTWMHNRNQVKIQAEEFSHQKEIKRKESHALLRLKALDVHAAFWNDSEMARRMISNDREYAELAKALEARTATTECDVSTEDYLKLELIDRFYAAVMRLHRLKEALATFGDDKDSEKMILDSYGYWVEILRRPAGQKGNRAELKKYLVRFWPGIAESISADARYGALG